MTDDNKMDVGEKPPDPVDSGGTQESVSTGVADANESIAENGSPGITDANGYVAGNNSTNTAATNVHVAASNNSSTNLQNVIIRPKVLYDEEVVCDSYKVLVQGNRDSNLSYHKLGQDLAQITNNSTEILNKEKLSKDKVLITCRNAKRANTLVNDETLSKKYNVFIPQNYVSRSAIIRDIDTDIPDNDIFESLETSQYKLISVHRLNRRTTDESGKVLYVPSKTMKLNFAGQDIPAYVYLWYSKVNCEPFIQSTLQCFKCMKFGHAASKCKAKFDVCKKCYQVQKEDHVCQTDVIKCLNCDGLHNPQNKNCPELKRQKDIKALMSSRNLCFQEAAKLIPSAKQSKDPRYSVSTSNSFNLLAGLNENFPSLSLNPANKKTIEKYVPPPLPYKSFSAHSNKNAQSGKKAQKRDSRPEASGLNISTNKKVRNEPKGKQENTVAPLFYKLCEQRKREEANQVTSQSTWSSLFSVPASGSSYPPPVLQAPNYTSFPPASLSVNAGHGSNHSGHQGVNPFSSYVQSCSNYNPKNNNRFHNNRFSKLDKKEINFSDEDISFKSRDRMDIGSTSPDLKY